eukprot:COSAG01_NODE_20733_length_938_cov_0.949940_1_plen_38_part_10
MHRRLVAAEAMVPKAVGGGGKQGGGGGRGGVSSFRPAA